GEEPAGEAAADEAAAPPADGEEGVAVARAGGATQRRPVSRDDVYRQLTEAADLLQRLEPHSPIPYLIQKAIELGAMPFPKLMKALIRNDDIIKEMNRELGIKEEGEA